MKIYFKNMHFEAQLLLVKRALDKLGISYENLEMGKVAVFDNVPERKLKQLYIELLPYRLNLAFDEKYKIILKIKTAIKAYQDNPVLENKINPPLYIAKKVNHNFYYLNYIFLEETGTTIEKYFNSKKIEKANELLTHYNLTLTEISYQLNYNSVEELTSDFKCLTGLTPDHYKQIKLRTQNIQEKMNV
jgi:AraC-like DNA-binding protein